MTGRGRGEAKMAAGDNPQGRAPLLNVGQSSDSEGSGSQGRSASGSGSGSGGDSVIRGRGGYRLLKTIPKNVTQTKCIKTPPSYKICELLTNYVEIKPMRGSVVYQYRFEFSPTIESIAMKRKIVGRHISEQIFNSNLTFDGSSDARSSVSLQQARIEVKIPSPTPEIEMMTVTIKKVGQVEWGSMEMLRLYNMGMRDSLRQLGFFQIQRGVYVHPSINTPIQSQGLTILRGFNTAANIHEDNKILMNMEGVHKIIQNQSVIKMMTGIATAVRQRGGNIQEAVKVELINKIIVTKYNNRCYRVEDVEFDVKATSTFRKNDKDITYVEYFAQAHGLDLIELDAPMLKVKPSNASRFRDAEQPERVIFVPPELCTLAGLTNEQANDNRVKMELVRSTQLDPRDRVRILNEFLGQLHNDSAIQRTLNRWGYNYEKSPKIIKAHILPPEPIGWHSNLTQNSNAWNKSDQNTASFEQMLNKEKIAVPPNFRKMYVLIPAKEKNCQLEVLGLLRQFGFEKVGLEVGSVQCIDMPDERPTTLTRALRELPPDSDLNMILLSRQNKERYDAIKRYSTCDRGIPTQVVTTSLMTNKNKQRGAATKIAIQIAAKLGGEPWHISLPLSNAMICGYDSYHDTTCRGRSFGAFVASTNQKFSRWYSKTNDHQKLEELSTKLTADLLDATNNWKQKNNRYPTRIILFRDGVGDGQLEHVFLVELKLAKRALKKLTNDGEDPIKLTMIIVNKRVGARFYQKQGNTFSNPTPGTVIDNTVTRVERYDFYLISQSTRQGTVSPTYYNVIYDESGLDPEKIQMMAYKLTLNYYNWAGGVRVPAPCQYAHKLAYQTGENLHSLPNARLANLLHYL